MNQKIAIDSENTLIIEAWPVDPVATDFLGVDIFAKYRAADTDGPSWFEGVAHRISANVMVPTGRFGAPRVLQALLVRNVSPCDVYVSVVERTPDTKVPITNHLYEGVIPVGKSLGFLTDSADVGRFELMTNCDSAYRMLRRDGHGSPGESQAPAPAPTTVETPAAREQRKQFVGDDEAVAIVREQQRRLISNRNQGRA